tara:strand:+ start:3130 stop:3987 length:858 start_codon:yes stop_codon:yes gene_type:complete
MISIVGIGTGASAIANKFRDVTQYDVYELSDKFARSSKRKHKLKKFETPEEYEKNVPNLKGFFKDLRETVQVFIVGTSYSSNYSLGILEQMKDKKLEVFYIKPDVDLVNGERRLVENVVFGVLQEYARSGLFESITVFSNLEIERTLGDVPIKTYYDTLNSAIFSAVHYLNYFTHAEPEIGQVAKPAEINRIRTMAILNTKNLHENWLFQLDNERELCYYICVNEERLASEGSLHRKLVNILKDKSTNAFRKISYAIYETPHKDFGYVVAHTNTIQQQKTLDKVD